MKRNSEEIRNLKMPVMYVSGNSQMLSVFGALQTCAQYMIKSAHLFRHVWRTHHDSLRIACQTIATETANVHPALSSQSWTQKLAQKCDKQTLLQPQPRLRFFASCLWASSASRRLSAASLSGQASRSLVLSLAIIWRWTASKTRRQALLNLHL